MSHCVSHAVRAFTHNIGPSILYFRVCVVVDVFLSYCVSYAVHALTQKLRRSFSDGFVVCGRSSQVSDILQALFQSVWFSLCVSVALCFAHNKGFDAETSQVGLLSFCVKFNGFGRKPLVSIWLHPQFTVCVSVARVRPLFGLTKYHDICILYL